MQAIYPEGPKAIPENLMRPSSAYRRQAWIATIALLAFAAFYVALAGWFGWKAYALIRASFLGRDGIWMFGGGAAAAFICVFMVKALFFVKRGELQGLTEIKPEDQPALFEFLHRLADEARAPRPRKVYRSTRVNAAVFYDLSPINLIFPSRKNLEIGLPLVNVLNVSELKAVLAHEFGHFAQRSMAVGRWVYVAQQIAGHLVSHRDALDKFLKVISNIDVRISWVGWLLSLVVWSIRSIVDTFFRVVLVAERALSREMEFQADMIAVSLTGSDALIEALYRCQSAEVAWDRALTFANVEAGKGKRTADLFEVQGRIIHHLRGIMDDPTFGTPPRAAQEPAHHRIFRKEMVQASRMWSSHPFNHEREDNAKRHYLHVQAETRSAWDLFSGANEIRTSASDEMFNHAAEPIPAATADETANALEQEYGRESYKRIYRGCYLSRDLTRVANRVDALYAAEPADRSAAYPASLADDLKTQESLQGEKAQLAALKANRAQATDGELRFRGKTLEKREIASALEDVGKELKAIEARLAAHDMTCRTVGRDLAKAQGQGWEAHLQGLLGLVHYAEHARANIQDAQGATGNLVSAVTAKRRVNKKELERVRVSALDLYSALRAVHEDRDTLKPDAATLAAMAVADWPAALGEWNFGSPTEDNLGKWLDAVDSWINPVVRALSNLRRAALDQLLLAEQKLNRAAYDGSSLGEAPAAAQLPATYRTFVAGSERPRVEKLDWWSRFQVADGWLPGGVRLLVAGGIIGTLMGMSATFGNATLAIHNGLDRGVIVKVGSTSNGMAPGATKTIPLDLDGPIEISTRTAKGQLIESFTEKPDVVNGQYVYNVASASPMVQWTAAYGNATQSPERPLGAPRFFLTWVDHLFETPPEQISTKGGGGSRQVLSTSSSPSVRSNMGMSNSDATAAALIAAHARWDDAQSMSLTDWLQLASEQPGAEAIINARLADNPLEIATLRAEQNKSIDAAHAAVCHRHTELAATQPGNGDLQYLAVRCIEGMAARNAAFKAGFARFPQNHWLAYAAAEAFEGDENWKAATDAYNLAARFTPLTDDSGLQLARIRRVEKGADTDIADLVALSPTLKLHWSAETGAALTPGNIQTYADLNKGSFTAVRKAAGETPPDLRALRLAAASDTAPPDLVDRALSLPAKEGTDYDVLWSAIGLALRNGKPIDGYLKMMGPMGSEYRARMEKFIGVMQSSRDVNQAEAAMAGASLHERAQAYTLGLVVMGAKAPPAWRALVKKALFPTERPYFA